MKFILHLPNVHAGRRDANSELDPSNVQTLHHFTSVLSRMGDITVIDDDIPLRKVLSTSQKKSERCVYLPFCRPDQLSFPLICPTVPVFDWAYETLPGTSDGRATHIDWITPLSRIGAAITHTASAASTVQRYLSPDFPVVSLPAPLWEEWTMPHADQEKPLTLPHLYDTHTRTHAVNAPLPPLGGTVFGTVLNPSHAGKNWRDILHAFCWAFQDTASATLLIKLTHGLPREAIQHVTDEIGKLPGFLCRVIVIAGHLDDAAYRMFVNACDYGVIASHAEGQCLPLLEFMASGCPAIAPRHTGLHAVLDDTNSLPVTFSREWTHWPIDPGLGFCAYHYIPNWDSLVHAMQQAHAIHGEAPDTYRALSSAARHTIERLCSRERAYQILTPFFDRLPPRDCAVHIPWYKRLLSSFRKDA